jgi:Na+/H+ antiporter NhaD/arsenite permease-like protein
VDWDLLLLFVGLFVVVGAAERAGLDRLMFEWLRPVGIQTVAGLSVSAVQPRQQRARCHVEYARVGVPMTLVTTAFGIWWLS